MMVIEVLFVCHVITGFISYGLNNGTYTNSFPNDDHRRHSFMVGLTGLFGILSLPMAFDLHSAKMKWGFKL
jgi:hypothetical protein